MREPSFWWHPPGTAALLLAPLAACYGVVSGARMRCAGWRAAVPVVCVGNLTVGGAGKTPTAIALVRMLVAAGERPFVLTRGYGGRLAGPVRVDPQTHVAAEVGDEPLLLARAAPTIVSGDRVAGARAAQAAGATVIVMDDGFQNPSLAKDMSLVVVDGRRGIGNGRVVPAGPLRAPLATQLASASALLVIGDLRDGRPVISANASGIPLFRGRLEPDPQVLAALAGKRVLAFAGIGDPEKFFKTVSEAGIETVRTQSFADHHRYTGAEAATLVAAAERDDLVLLTTEKDYARITGDGALSVLAACARTLPVSLRVDDQGALDRLVCERLRDQGMSGGR